jgi:hypothetical protein
VGIERGARSAFLFYRAHAGFREPRRDLGPFLASCSTAAVNSAIVGGIRIFGNHHHADGATVEGRWTEIAVHGRFVREPKFGCANREPATTKPSSASRRKTSAAPKAISWKSMAFAPFRTESLGAMEVWVNFARSAMGRVQWHDSCGEGMSRGKVKADHCLVLTNRDSFLQRRF